MTEHNEVGAGVTVSFQLNQTSTRAGLVADDDGNLFVAVKVEEGLGEEDASDLAQLITHLSNVTRLARDLRVSSPLRLRTLPDALDDDGDAGLDQDLSGRVDRDQAAFSSEYHRLDSLDGVGVGPKLFAAVNHLPSDDGPVAHDSSPSAGGCGDHSVGDGRSSGAESSAPEDIAEQLRDAVRNAAVEAAETVIRDLGIGGAQ